MTLKKTLEKIANQYGDTIVARLDREPNPVPMVSTGIRALDQAIATGTISGIGGFPRSRITTLYGPESGGKSTIALWALGKLIAAGGTGVYIDMEQGGSEEYVFACVSGAGASIEKAVKENRLVILRPETAEAAMEIAKSLVKHADLMFVDSISVMMTQAELDSPAGKALIGVKARFQTSEFTKLCNMLGATQCALVIVSHIRAAITSFGSYETTTEPNAVRHLASVRIRVAKDKKAIMRDGKPYAQPAVGEVKKNKVGAPGVTAGFDIVYGKGIDEIRDVFETACGVGLIRRGGSRYYWPADAEKEEAVMKITGERHAIVWLQEHPDVCAEIEAQL